MEDKTVSRVVTSEERLDSVFYGTPGNGGFKIYGDVTNKEAMEAKVKAAMSLIDYAKKLAAESKEGGKS